MISEALMGAVSITIGGLASVAVALISRPRPAPADGAPDDGPDLTTITGIAKVVARQGEQLLQQGEDLREAGVRIEQLETGRAADGRLIRALRRRCTQLEAALRQLGAEVPEPAPDDAPLIKG
ncbi:MULTISPECIES: hypothetical protein [unclassified Streptomyces]|uniref:hypothetical protein n=1 Tax=unclassified Streptomyces TaxID=2593676 RepID=UPI00364F1502